MTRGRLIWGRQRVVAAVFATVGLAASLVGAPAALAAPSLSMNPASGQVGATVTATASDFPAGSVTFRWDNSQLIGTAETDAQGTAVIQFAIPSATTLGAHFVRACASSKCPQGTIFADATLTVVAPPTPAPSPTLPPTPRPTSAPTPRVTPTARPPTPRPSTPVVTTGPASPTPIVSGSPLASPTASHAPTLVPTPSAIASPAPPASSDPAGGTPSPAPLHTLLPAGPTAGGDGSLVGVVVPVGAIGAMLLVGFLLVSGRWRPGLASTAGAVVAGARSARRRSAWRRGRDDEPDALSALHDPVAAFLEPIGASAPAAEVERTASSEPPASADPAPAPPADPWSRARTISMHVEHIEADDA